MYWIAVTVIVYAEFNVIHTLATLQQKCKHFYQTRMKATEQVNLL